MELERSLLSTLLAKSDPCLSNQHNHTQQQLERSKRLVVIHRPRAVGTIRTHGFIAIDPPKLPGNCTMAYQNINATLSEKDIQEIKASLQKIQEKLPFLITLSVEERRKLFKMGDKSLAFVNNSLTAAQSNRDILPASFDLDEFVQDYQLATTLTELLLGLRQLTEQVDDTLLAVGSEAMSSSLTVYDYVKTAAKKTPGLKTLAQQLGERFKAIRNKSASVASES